jgi:hypothetical protein
MKNRLVFHLIPIDSKGNWSIGKVTARGDSKAGYWSAVVAREVVLMVPFWQHVDICFCVVS